MNPGDIFMEHRIVQNSSESPTASTQDQPNVESRFPAEKHPVLSRLLEEVRNERDVEAAYDRVHNRHNRGN